MRVTILGSGTLFPDAERGSASHLVEDGDVRLLLDCGAGVIQSLARCGADWRALTHIALSHFHTDHTGSLPALLWALRVGAGERGPLTVLGPVGLRARMGAMALAFGDYVLDPGFPLHVVELGRSDRWSDGELQIGTHPTDHTADSVAYRVECSAAMGYTGDTGPTDGLGRFLRGATLLIAECSSDDAQPIEGHLTPEAVAALAREAGSELVLLTHAYPGFDRGALAEAVAGAGIPGRCLPAGDGLVVEWKGGRPVSASGGPRVDGP